MILRMTSRVLLAITGPEVGSGPDTSEGHPGSPAPDGEIVGPGLRASLGYPHGKAGRDLVEVVDAAVGLNVRTKPVRKLNFHPYPVRCSSVPGGVRMQALRYIAARREKSRSADEMGTSCDVMQRETFQCNVARSRKYMVQSPASALKLVAQDQSPKS